MTEYERVCSGCGSKIIYKSYSGYYNANRNDSKCKECYTKIAGRKRSETWGKRKKDKEYSRNCPNCGTKIFYKSRQSVWLGNKNNSKCQKCYREGVRESMVGTKYQNRKSNKKDLAKEKYFRKCPECKKVLGYQRKDSYQRAIRKNSVCNSCATYKYNKTFKDNITEDSIRKMRASKAGFDSWEEYVECYPEKQMYKREVWRLTYQQPLESLLNFDLRGRCGVPGAYQIDHMVSIEEGFQSGIPVEEIAHISNLQMLPWEDNRQKGS